MTNQYVNGTFSKSYFTASNNFDIKLSKSLCSNIEQWFLDCDDMQALPKNDKGELANKTLKDTNYELLALPKYANEKGKMLKVDNEKKDEIRFFLHCQVNSNYLYGGLRIYDKVHLICIIYMFFYIIIINIYYVTYTMCLSYT